MPLSLKCMIDKLAHKGQISEEEHKQMLDKLKGHDKQVREDAIDEVKEVIRNNKGYFLTDGMAEIFICKELKEKKYENEKS